MSRPVGEVQVFPTTLFRDNRAGCSAAFWGRIGEREGRPRNGELDGVSLRRLEGVEAMFACVIGTPSTAMRGPDEASC